MVYVYYNYVEQRARKHCGIDHFDVLFQKVAAGFRTRLFNCENTLVNSIVNFLLF